MKEIQEQQTDYGYSRMNQELRKRGYIVNKKKVQLEYVKKYFQLSKIEMRVPFPL
ncbi:IS3 family transposase [Enterococcus faecalis]|uniref:IS3 family transposase n=1 Tax=Enterococcus faecalis TaxID=1351 RepID=UPI00242E86BD|nr:IS3 family transposase [Enterococcus faecalis]